VTLLSIPARERGLISLGIVRDGIKGLNVTNVVFDGELCLVDENGNEDFQGVMKQLKKKDHTIPNPSFKIFDMISHDEFYSKNGESNKPYCIRYNNLREVMRNNTCTCLSVLSQDLLKTMTILQSGRRRLKIMVGKD
jgi:ATP-dependent DNA ligase